MFGLFRIALSKRRGEKKKKKEKEKRKRKTKKKKKQRKILSISRKKKLAAQPPAREILQSYPVPDYFHDKNDYSDNSDHPGPEIAIHVVH